MATHDIHSDSMASSGFAPETQASAETLSQEGGLRQWRDGFFWLNRAFYIIGAIAGVGFLVALVGAYVVPEDTTLVVGTIIFLASVALWIIAATIMIVMIAKDLVRILRRILWSRQSK